MESDLTLTAMVSCVESDSGTPREQGSGPTRSHRGMVGGGDIETDHILSETGSGSSGLDEGHLQAQRVR